MKKGLITAILLAGISLFPAEEVLSHEKYGKYISEAIQSKKRVICKHVDGVMGDKLVHAHYCNIGKNESYIMEVYNIIGRSLDFQNQKEILVMSEHPFVYGIDKDKNGDFDKDDFLFDFKEDGINGNETDLKIKEHRFLPETKF